MFNALGAIKYVWSLGRKISLAPLHFRIVFHKIFAISTTTNPKKRFGDFKNVGWLARQVFRNYKSESIFPLFHFPTLQKFYFVFCKYQFYNKILFRNINSDYYQVLTTISDVDISEIFESCRKFPKLSETFRNLWNFRKFYIKTF